MKLAEALKKRKTLRLLVTSLANSIKTDAYDAATDNEKKLKKLASVVEALANLSSDIAKVNATVTVETRFGTLSLAQTKAIRDELTLASTNLTAVATLSKFTVLKGGATYDAVGQRVTTPDTKIPVNIDLDDVLVRANQTAKDARELDTLLQAANWTTELAGSAETI